MTLPVQLALNLSQPALPAATPAPQAKPRDRWLSGEVEPWQMTKSEMLASDIIHMKYGAHSSSMGNNAGLAKAHLQQQIRKAIAGHRADVAQALAEGKPVPPEVLADYPDLAATQAEAASAPPLTPETAKVGDILASEAGRCVIVGIDVGGYVTVRPLDQAHYTPLAPCDLAYFRRTGETDLKPALPRYLEQYAEARLGDLQMAWGYSRAMGNTPKTNPLNRALKELADASRVAVNAEGWGFATNPRITLPPPVLVAPEAPRQAFADPHKPLGTVPVADETRYYGTALTVVSHGEQIKTWLSKIYNGGALFEVHNPHCPHDLQATFRVSGEQVVSIDHLVDRRATPDAPLPHGSGVEAADA